MINGLFCLAALLVLGTNHEVTATLDARYGTGHRPAYRSNMQPQSELWLALLAYVNSWGTW